MTLPEAIDHLRKALSNAKPGCFVPVSGHALALVLAELESKGESDGAI